MRRLHEVWSVEPDLDANERVTTQPRGDLEIRDLTFTYTNRAVLSDINLSVRHGETVGIVGRTGSGKSTLLSLLTRTFEPPPGTIFLDGRPSALRRRFRARSRDRLRRAGHPAVGGKEPTTPIPARAGAGAAHPDPRRLA